MLAVICHICNSPMTSTTWLQWVQLTMRPNLKRFSEQPMPAGYPCALDSHLRAKAYSGVNVHIDHIAPSVHRAGAACEFAGCCSTAVWLASMHRTGHYAQVRVPGMCAAAPRQHMLSMSSKLKSLLGFLPIVQTLAAPQSHLECTCNAPASLNW